MAEIFLTGGIFIPPQCASIKEILTGAHATQAFYKPHIYRWFPLEPGVGPTKSSAALNFAHPQVATSRNLMNSKMLKRRDRIFEAATGRDRALGSI
jgi:hypothetical protein